MDQEVARQSVSTEKYEAATDPLQIISTENTWCADQYAPPVIAKVVFYAAFLIDWVEQLTIVFSQLAFIISRMIGFLRVTWLIVGV